MAEFDPKDEEEKRREVSADDVATVDLDGAETDVAADGATAETQATGPSPAVTLWPLERAPRAAIGRARMAGVGIVADASTARTTLEAGRTEGEMIGRFTVLEQLGEGGMGVVVSAYDPTLDRKIAIKLLHRDARLEGGHGESALRMVREAQAMAKVAHPNVVAVHEVGTVGEEVYIAMEYVEGGTLADWREEPHSWREVIDLMSQAGEGLAAAHSAGLVHRDFKPENVLIGEDGRVRVSDFGLVGARGVVPRPELDDGGDLERLGSVLQAVTLRSKGVLLGTLAYMAPEQFEQKRADARADQFGFCVTLYETLYGTRPFAGDDYGELRRAVCTGALRAPPPDTTVPGWIYEVLARGMSADPDDRYPSMRALLQALARDPAALRRRRRIALAVGAAFVATAAIAAFALTRGSGDRGSRCKGLRARIDSVWDARAKSALEAAFVANGRPYAREAYTRVAEALDQYADAWGEMRTETCEATFLRGTQTEAVLDLRMTCLDRRLSAMQALIGVIGEGADDAMLGHAVEAATRLPPIAGCGDVAALRAATPAPEDPELRAQVEGLRSRLHRANALLDAGKYADGAEVARGVVEEARQLGHAPTLALALYRLGQLELRADQLDAGEASLREAIRVGAAAKADRLVVDAWQELAWLIGVERALYDDALALRETIEAAIARAGNPPEERADYLRTIGVLQHAKGEYRAARETLEQAVALIDEAPRLLEPDAAQIVRSLGITAIALGDLAAARKYHERAKRILERNYGPRHPHVALALESLADVAREEGNDELALKLRQQVLDIDESFLGPEHREVAMALNNLGVQLSRLDRYEEARAAYERALAIWEKQLRPGHPDLANALNNLGEVAAAAGDLEGARSYFERTVEVLEKALGPEHVRTAQARFNVGGVLQEQGRYREALPLMKRARDAFAKALGERHPFVGYPMGGIGACLVELGEPEKAVAPLERAVGLLGEGHRHAEPRASTRFNLARALWDSKRDRRRAIAQARLAREESAGLGERGKKALVDIDRWLKTHQ